MLNEQEIRNLAEAAQAAYEYAAQAETDMLDGKIPNEIDVGTIRCHLYVLKEGLPELIARLEKAEKALRESPCMCSGFVRYSDNFKCPRCCYFAELEEGEKDG